MKHDTLLEEHYQRRGLAGLNLPTTPAPPAKSEEDEDPVKSHLARRYKMMETYIKRN